MWRGQADAATFTAKRAFVCAGASGRTCCGRRPPATGGRRWPACRPASGRSREARRAVPGRGGVQLAVRAATRRHGPSSSTSAYRDASRPRRSAGRTCSARCSGSVRAGSSSCPRGELRPGARLRPLAAAPRGEVMFGGRCDSARAAADRAQRAVRARGLAARRRLRELTRLPSPVVIAIEAVPGRP